jgi:hypothetical protein
VDDLARVLPKPGLLRFSDLLVQKFFEPALQIGAGGVQGRRFRASSDSAPVRRRDWFLNCIVESLAVKFARKPFFRLTDVEVFLLMHQLVPVCCVLPSGPLAIATKLSKCSVVGSEQSRDSK